MDSDWWKKEKLRRIAVTDSNMVEAFYWYWKQSEGFRKGYSKAWTWYRVKKQFKESIDAPKIARKF